MNLKLLMFVGMLVTTSMITNLHAASSPEDFDGDGIYDAIEHWLADTYPGITDDDGNPIVAPTGIILGNFNNITLDTDNDGIPDIIEDNLTFTDKNFDDRTICPGDGNGASPDLTGQWDMREAADTAQPVSFLTDYLFGLSICHSTAIPGIEVYHSELGWADSVSFNGTTLTLTATWGSETLTATYSATGGPGGEPTMSGAFSGHTEQVKGYLREIYDGLTTPTGITAWQEKLLDASDNAKNVGYNPLSFSGEIKTTPGTTSAIFYSEEGTAVPGYYLPITNSFIFKVRFKAETDADLDGQFDDLVILELESNNLVTESPVAGIGGMMRGIDEESEEIDLDYLSSPGSDTTQSESFETYGKIHGPRVAAFTTNTPGGALTILSVNNVPTSADLISVTGPSSFSQFLYFTGQEVDIRSRLPGFKDGERVGLNRDGSTLDVSNVNYRTTPGAALLEDGLYTFTFTNPANTQVSLEATYTQPITLLSVVNQNSVTLAASPFLTGLANARPVEPNTSYTIAWTDIGAAIYQIQIEPPADSETTLLRGFIPGPAGDCISGTCTFSFPAQTFIEAGGRYSIRIGAREGTSGAANNNRSQTDKFFVETDSDGDTVSDINDACPTGETGWTSDAGTDFDGDGCRDATEDLDDDNDGLPDTWEVDNGLNPLDTTSPNGATHDPDNDGYNNLAEFNADTDPQDASSHPLTIVQNVVNVGSDWWSIDHGGSLFQAVVITAPPSYLDAEPGVVRLRNVDANGFEIRFQEWDYLDGTHNSEDIPYLVVEPGRYSLADGTVLEAGTFTLDGTGKFVPQSFSAAFPGTPMLLLTTQTYAGTQAVTARARNVTATGFEAAFYEQQLLMDGHAVETVGYLAIYHASATGTLPINEVDTTFSYGTINVDHNWAQLGTTALRVEEEQSLDSEVDHAIETLAYFNVGGKNFVQDVTVNGPDPAALRRYTTDTDSDGLVNVVDDDDDGDSLPDTWEIANGFDPLDATGVNGASGDPDSDSFGNLAEYTAGTDPKNPDTDDDGMNDAWESFYNLNPLDSADAWQDPDNDASPNFLELVRYPTLLSSTDPNDPASVPLGIAGPPTTRVSTDIFGVLGDGFSSAPSISADGRYVAFTSAATNLVSGDTNNADDIFVRDRQTGLVTRVSLGSSGSEGTGGGSGNPSISANGRYVAFDSLATTLVDDEDTNGGRDVFVHDRQTGITTRISNDRFGTGNEGNGASVAPSISANGRYVAFHSAATNLVAGDTNPFRDVFIHDRHTGTTTRVSVDSLGTEGNEDSFTPSISGDGRYLVFSSWASNLVSGDTNGAVSKFDGADVFVHDRQTGTTTRVSVDSDGNQGNLGSYSYLGSISADGRYVAFASEASNLVSGDTNGAVSEFDGSDIFVHDRQTGTTTRISIDSSGIEGNGFSNAPAINANGRYVTFYSAADNLVAGDTNTIRDIFIHDRQTATTTRVSVDDAGVEANGHNWFPVISANGRYVAFGSDASNLVSGDTNSVRDVFVHDMLNLRQDQVSTDSNWTTITHDVGLSQAVVITAPPSYFDSDPGVVRLRNVTGNEFEVRFQEWDHLDGIHGLENIPYLVAEAGHYVLADGTVLEVGTFTLDGTGTFALQSFSATFPGMPTLLLTTQTYTGVQAVTARARNVTASGFEAAFYEQQALMDGHAAETVGYLAIYHASATGTLPIDGVDTTFTYGTINVDHNWAQLNTTAIRVEEEQSSDAETDHALETLTYLNVGGENFAQDVTVNGPDPAALRRYTTDTDSDGLVNVVDDDDDGDGLPDTWEIANGFDPLDATGVNGASGDPDGDGLININEYFAGADPHNPDSDSDGTPDGIDTRPLDASYRGSESGIASLNQDWGLVNLPTFFNAPVVIAGPPTQHSTDPGVVRIQNVTGNGFEAKFELRFQEWDYLDGSHATEDIPHLVLEQGRVTMPDGSIIEVGTFTLDGTGTFTDQAYTAPFAATPHLFLTIQTYNGTQAATVRAKNVTASGFEAALFEQQSLMDGHASETVGYLAIYNPAGSGLTNIGGQELPYLLQRQATKEGFTPVGSHALMVEEEKSLDEEVVHLDETLDIMILGNRLFAQDVTSNGTDTAALRRLAPEYGAAMEWGTVTGMTDSWMTVPLAKTYTNPVVVVKPLSSLDIDPATVQVRNVTADHFELRIKEWDYLDGTHIAQERCFFMVVEAGQRSLAGLTVEAGTVNITGVLKDGVETAVILNAGFASTPALFTGVQSTNDIEAVTTRLKNVGANSFTIAMQEEEAKLDSHGTETVAYIAIATGTGVTLDNRKIEVTTATASHVPSTVNFASPKARRFPVILTDLNTTNEPDPAMVVYSNLLSTQVNLYVREEQSQDTETEHATEIFSVFVAE